MHLRQQGWFQIYATYDSKSLASRPPSYLSSRSLSQQSQPYRTPYRSLAPPPGPSPQSRVYWADEEKNNYIYNASLDAYITAPGYEPHPAGHTPRRLGNTHDGQRGAEAEANWASADQNHRCTHQGYTHYH